MGPRRDTPDQRDSAQLSRLNHELRTPLNAILGMLELSLGEPLSDTLRDYLTTALRSARSLIEALDGLIDLARAERGQLELESAPLPLRKTLEEALGALQPLAESRGVAISWRVAEGMPEAVAGDARRLRQLFAVLVGHSIQSTAARQVGAELEPVARGADSVTALLIVSDAAGAETERQRFVPPEADTASAGTAARASLGLLLAGELVKAMDGQLWLEGASGSGGRSCCTFRISLADEQALERSGAQPAGPGSAELHLDAAPLPRTDRPLSVLVADDTPANQKVVKAILTRRGHEVELADNGRQALDRLSQRPFDVVLMDAQMPMMDGLEAATAIRRMPDPARSHVPIIAMTAHALRGDRERCLAAGMDDYLPKPIDVASLVARVEFYGTSRHGELLPGGAGAPAAPFAPKSHGPLSESEERMLARLGGDARLLGEVIRLFQQEAPTIVRAMRAALEASDSESLLRGAHSLRGLAGSFDDEPTIEAARTVERYAASGDLADSALALKPLERELARLASALEDLRQRLR
jgi:CheY-like chemotaxis protein